MLPDQPRSVPDWYHRVMALTVRTDEQMEQALDALVETEGVSRQEVIRRSILDRYERTVHARPRRGRNEPAECALGGRARAAWAVVSETEYLDLEDLLSIVRALGIGPVRDLGLLDSAAARPRASAFAEDAYPTIELKAAALLHSLARNHSLVDGNKRLSWLAVVVFLDLNGCEVTLSDEEAFQLVMDVVSSDIELDEIVRRLQVSSTS